MEKIKEKREHKEAVKKRKADKRKADEAAREKMIADREAELEL